MSKDRYFCCSRRRSGEAGDDAVKEVQAATPLSLPSKRRREYEIQRGQFGAKKRRTNKAICPSRKRKRHYSDAAILVIWDEVPQLKDTLLSFGQQDLLFAFQHCKKVKKPSEQKDAKKRIEVRSNEEQLATKSYKLSKKLERAKLLQPGHYSRNIMQTSDDYFSINISTMGISTSTSSSTPQAKSLLEIKPKAKNRLCSVTIKTNVYSDTDMRAATSPKERKLNISARKERYSIMTEIASKEDLQALKEENLYINYEIVISF